MESTPQPHRAQHEVCAALSDALLLTVAASGDIGAVFDMVNTAYKVEDGDSGVAFKKTDRFLSHDEGDAFNPL
jgi:2C-methyl-D-erythritol 2,4-cyclodiphosphate synthase